MSVRGLINPGDNMNSSVQRSDSICGGGSLSGERVTVFIDLANIVKTCECMDGAEVDYNQMVEQLANGRTLRGKYVFDSSPCNGENRLHNKLRRLGFRVMNGCMLENNIQKGVDVELACTMMRHAFQNDFDTAILVSGDADFISVIRSVQGMGKCVEVASFSASMSHHLKASGDSHIILDSLPIFRDKAEGCT